MIPMPLLMWFATLTGQPVTIIILPGEVPQYQLNSSVTAPPLPLIKSEVPGCYTLVCKV